MINIKNVNLFNKRVLIKLNFDVPIKNGKILLDSKIINSIPTIKYVLKSNAYVMICSYLGNPNEKYINNLSLEPIKYIIEKKIKIKVNLIKNYLFGIDNLNKGVIYLLENLRFNNGELFNDINLSIKYSNLCDVFVIDDLLSFRNLYSSDLNITKFVKISCFGLIILKELNNINYILNNYNNLLSILACSKINEKLDILNFLFKISKKVFIGGITANTILKYNGYNIGKSIFEILDNKIINKILNNKKIILPSDIKVSYNISYKNNKYDKINKLIRNIDKNDIIIDLGNTYINKIIKCIKKYKIIIWIGSTSIYDFDKNNFNTKIILKEIINNNLFSIIGGEHISYFIKKSKLFNKLSFISNFGSSFLELIKYKDILKL